MLVLVLVKYACISDESVCKYYFPNYEKRTLIDFYNTRFYNF